MKKLIYILVLFLLTTCSITSDTTNSTFIKAKIYMDSPCNCTYNIFQVISPNKFDKPEINVSFEQFIQKYPHEESSIRNDTIHVRLQPFKSKFNTIRYRLIEILNS